MYEKMLVYFVVEQFGKNQINNSFDELMEMVQTVKYTRYIAWHDYFIPAK